MTEKTTISILKKTRDRLSSFGQKCDTYDDIINSVLDEKEGKKKK